MFERRLKILLIILLLCSAALAIRAAQIQIVKHDFWLAKAGQLMNRDEFVETTRGRILDIKGRTLAQDAPCVDACVDYRAIPDDPDSNWLYAHAIQNLKARLGASARSAQWKSPQWAPIVDEECARLRADLNAMWLELTAVSGKTPDEINQIRADIVRRVEMRKRYVWWRNFKPQADQFEKDNTNWYRHLLSDTPPDESAIDQFEVNVTDETSPHMILHNISSEVQARLARQQDRFFCLTLVPSKYRQYPLGRVACNVLGYLGTVPAADIAADANLTDSQVQQRWSDLAQRLWPADLLDRYPISAFHDLRKYWPADLVGRAGVEALCENTLRGTRGRIETRADTGEVVDRIDAVPGRDVSTSIDIFLQQAIENDFARTRIHTTKDGVETRFNQHGAAVVIKIDTGQVLALVSNPGFDLNDLDAHYSEYAADDLNHPLLDRATELHVEPGSTVKPIVGSAAIATGKMTSTSTIQCRGVLYIDGKPQRTNHCWIYQSCIASGLAPDEVSHRQDLNEANRTGPDRIGPDDQLTITDGIRVSCNVVFETIAQKMGGKSLSNWFDLFGIGRKTGIGIEENPGLLYHPSDNAPAIATLKMCSMAIGEGLIQATPLQMANVAATLARNGIWMRPRLVADADASPIGQIPADANQPDRVDLHLPPDAVSAVQTGMREVCSPGGSGDAILPEKIERGPDDPPLDQDPLRGIPIAGKTGTAQIGHFMTLVDRDADGKPVTREIHFGDPGTEGWYLPPNAPDGHPEKHLAHAWFIGYAPADHPQIAFAVLVEYGEAGGRVAGPIAHDLLVDCIKQGYLSPAK